MIINNKSLRGILFDKDGTLFDFHQTWLAWIELVLSDLAAGDAAVKQQLADAVGYDLAGQKFIAGSMIVIATGDKVNAALQACIPHMSVAAVNDVALRHLEDLPNFPVCELRPLLLDLRDRGFVLGVATNDFHAAAEMQLKAAQISDLFTFVCGCDSGFGGKPGAGMINGFCKASDLKPAQIVVVGDSIHDLEAGREAGAGLNIGVLTGPATESELAPWADVVLPDISTLPATL